MMPNSNEDRIGSYLDEIRQQRAQRGPMQRERFDFSMSPELKQIVQGTHRVDNSRMNALRGDIASMASSIKPLKQGMDSEGEVRDQASRLRQFEQGHDGGMDMPRQRNVDLGGMATSGNPRSIRTDKFARPDRETERPTGGQDPKSELMRLGLQGASALLGHLHKKSGKKVYKTDSKGNVLRDASGAPVSKRKGGNKILKFLSENVGTLGEQALGAMANRRSNNTSRRTNNPHQMAGQEEY
jgi:hypothetical protein